MVRFQVVVGNRIIPVLLSISVLACGPTRVDDSEDGTTTSTDGGDGDGDGDGECPTKSLAEGEWDIGVLPVSPSFFRVVLELEAAVATAEVEARAAMDELALSLGLETGAAPADIRAALDAKLAAFTSGGMLLLSALPDCDGPLAFVADVASECDPEAQGIGFACSEPCEIDPSDEGACTTIVSCVGSRSACSGNCTGDCQMDFAASCAGRCVGTCAGTCTVRDGMGNCAGLCDGMCQGTCEVISGPCNGSCDGTCTWAQPDSSCAGEGTPLCEDVPICADNCGAIASPEQVSAECEAIVRAAGPGALACQAPPVQLLWQWSAQIEGDATAQAEFHAWIDGVEPALATLQTNAIHLAWVTAVLVELDEAANGAIRAAMQAGNDSCALEALPEASGILAEAMQKALATQSGNSEVRSSFE